MKLFEALEIFSTELSAECATYYGRMDPDPWYEANKILENAIGQPEEVLDAAVEKYVQTLKQLEAAYKMSGMKATPSPMVSGFHSPSVEAASERAAKKDRRCTDCFTATNLVPLRTAEGIIPICRNCRSKRDRNHFNPHHREGRELR